MVTKVLMLKSGGIAAIDEAGSVSFLSVGALSQMDATPGARQEIGRIAEADKRNRENHDYCVNVAREWERGELADLLDNALDIEYMIDSRGGLLGAKIWVTLGGPNVHIDTKRGAVVLDWWGEHAECSIELPDINDYLEELWESVRA